MPDEAVSPKPTAGGQGQPVRPLDDNRCTFAWLAPLGGTLLGVGLLVGAVAWFMWMANYGESEFAYFLWAVLVLAALFLLPGIILLAIALWLYRREVIAAVIRPRVLAGSLVGLILVGTLGYTFHEWAWRSSRTEVRQLPDLRGKTIPEVVKQLGNPDETSCFLTSDRLKGSRAELFKIYPPGRPGSAGVEILEYRYRDFRGVTIVWFHRPGGTWAVAAAAWWSRDPG